MTALAICGIRGRMGQTLLRLAAESEDLRVVAGITGRAAAEPAVTALPDGIALHSAAQAAEAVRAADVVIDFSTAAATHALLTRAGDALAGRALIVGTTGLTQETEQLLDGLSARAAVLTAANFSIGVNLMLSLAARVASILEARSYDVEIVEAHHRRKTDAPSGTALALGAAVARGRQRELEDIRRDGRTGDTGERSAGELAFHAVRGGGIAGEHTVMFLGERERLELRHEAFDRALFADGALAAARWMRGRPPGRHTMAEVLGLDG